MEGWTLVGRYVSNFSNSFVLDIKEGSGHTHKWFFSRHVNDYRYRNWAATSSKPILTISKHTHNTCLCQTTSAITFPPTFKFNIWPPTLNRRKAHLSETTPYREFCANSNPVDHKFGANTSIELPSPANPSPTSSTSNSTTTTQ